MILCASQQNGRLRRRKKEGYLEAFCSAPGNRDRLVALAAEALAVAVIRYLRLGSTGVAARVEAEVTRLPLGPASFDREITPPPIYV